ncbi:MAG: MBL fold metallo-hydrolase [Desulfurococcus sp.]|nr:MBL fold metallo-hydrolase [Desulfurococcus sp.]
MLARSELKRLLEYIGVHSNGAVLLGRNVVADGFSERAIRVVTHAHIDHVLGLEDSVKFSKIIAGTAVTLDLIEALGYVDRSILPLYKLKKKQLKYGECDTTSDDRLCLLPASHIPGSTQVYVESDGFRLGYTGDFKLDESTVIMKGLDALVIEATYGNPHYRRPFKKEVPVLLVDLVEEGLRRYKRVYIYGYHGKLQEAMMILRERGVDAPFMLPRKIFNVTRLLEKHGFRINDYWAEEEYRGFNNERVVVFKHMRAAEYRRLDGSGLHIILSGWEFKEPARRLDEYTFLLALSDHADFDELVEYVEKGGPGLVVVDASREGEAWSLRESLVKKGFCSIVMPSMNLHEQLEECKG